MNTCSYFFIQLVFLTHTLNLSSHLKSLRLPVKCGRIFLSKGQSYNHVHLCTIFLQSFMSSGCVEHLDFLNSLPDSDIFQAFKEKVGVSTFKSLTEIPKAAALEDDFHLEEKVFISLSFLSLAACLLLLK